METKKCSKCGEFSIISGYGTICDICETEYQKEYYNKKKEQLRQYKKEWWLKNRYKTKERYYKYVCECGRKTANENKKCSRCSEKKTIFKCIQCGKLISREDDTCISCKVENKKYKNIYKTLKCDWCLEDKNIEFFSHGSKSNFGNGKKIFCNDCKNKYSKEIEKKLRDDNSVSIMGKNYWKNTAPEELKPIVEKAVKLKILNSKLKSTKLEVIKYKEKQNG